MIDNLEEIDELNVSLPVETQRLISAAPVEVNSPIAVDRKNLERAKVYCTGALEHIEKIPARRDKVRLTESR